MVSIPTDGLLSGDERVHTGTVPNGTYAVTIHERHPDELLVYPGSDTPGLPAEVLRVLAAMNLDLTRLEARPSTTELGDYIYHLDFEHERTEQIVCRLESVTEWTRYLGSYDLITE